MTRRRYRTHRTLLALLAAFAALTLVAAACSDDSTDDGASPTTSSAGEGGGTEGDADEPELGPRVETYDGAETEAPDEFDVVTVVEQGDPDADNVLVLVPGTSAGAGYFLPLGEDLVSAAPDWQVWSVDRRENQLEDHSLIADRRDGTAETQEVFDYYLGWIADDTISPRFEPPSDDEVAFARDWGMAVAVEDLRVVIDEAASRGGKVVLAGHSLGGNITVAYATWDFDGTPGFEQLDGIGLIDGGSGPLEDTAELDAGLAELERGTPFNDLLGVGLPWAPGVFNVLGATGVLLEPEAPSLAYEFPLLPDTLKPPVPPTNEGQYGYALDVDTSPENLRLVHLSLGSLAEEGEPRGWVDDGAVPIERAARMFAGIEGIDGTAWYHPLRLTLDGRTTNLGNPHPAQEALGVRAIHGAELDLPLYAFETGFGQGRIVAGARALAEQGGLAEDQVTLVERHDVTHTDPMAIDPDNPLVETLVPFLESIAGA